MDKEPDLSDDELLAIPEDDVPTGGIARLWSVRSEQRHLHDLAELAAEKAGVARPFMLFEDQTPEARRRRDEERRREEEYEMAMMQVHERQDRLLRSIEAAQRENDHRRKEIEDNALRLKDGRHVYVDGDHYRDAQGRVLTGADAEEAAKLHRLHPEASTWQEKEEAERQAEALRRQKEQLLKDRDSGIPPEEAGKRLDGYEKEFAQEAAARQHEMQAQVTPDYGSADYSDMLSSVPAFTAAAQIASHETIGQPADTETESSTADAKKAPRPSGQGALKLG